MAEEAGLRRHKRYTPYPKSKAPASEPIAIPAMAPGLSVSVSSSLSVEEGASMQFIILLFPPSDSQHSLFVASFVSPKHRFLRIAEQLANVEQSTGTAQVSGELKGLFGC